MKNMAADDDLVLTEGSGDVFADLGFPDPGLARAKAELAFQIHETIRRRGWNQTKAAEVMGIDQPKVSAIFRGRLSDFSLDRLVTYLDRLGHTIQFRIGVKSTLAGSTDLRKPKRAGSKKKPVHAGR
jgi:predicted XRE-type DNA-binding protein